MPVGRGKLGGMVDDPLLKKLDAVTIRVPDLDQGLRFYRDALGHRLRWRHDEIGQAALAMPGSDTEIVLSTELDYAPDWLVDSAPAAAQAIEAAGGRTVAGPFEIPVGQVMVAADPFGNELILVDLSKGQYVTRPDGQVTGVDAAP
jgi:catechol 2,3-dioxygenase-like lactoylglutathione lyase family enzyme